MSDRHPAYEEGRRAFARGVSFLANPHHTRHGSPEFLAWQDGWLDAGEEWEDTHG